MAFINNKHFIQVFVTTAIISLFLVLFKIFNNGLDLSCILIFNVFWSWFFGMTISKKSSF
jgi:hypothetical protein